MRPREEYACRKSLFISTRQPTGAPVRSDGTDARVDAPPSSVLAAPADWRVSTMSKGLLVVGKGVAAAVLASLLASGLAILLDPWLHELSRIRVDIQPDAQRATAACLAALGSGLRRLARGRRSGRRSGGWLCGGRFGGGRSVHRRRRAPLSAPVRHWMATGHRLRGARPCLHPSARRKKWRRVATPGSEDGSGFNVTAYANGQVYVDPSKTATRSHQPAGHSTRFRRHGNPRTPHLGRPLRHTRTG